MSNPASAAPASSGNALLPLALVAAAVAALFGPTFLALVRLWDIDPNYSHGYLVPFISAGLAWWAYSQAGAPADGQPAAGVAWIALGLLIHTLTALASWPLLDFPAIVLVLHGVAVAAGGRLWARHYLFALLFLVFMFPWPPTWMSRTALFLQEWVSIFSEAVLNLFVVCYRKGTTLKIAGVADPLVVAEECSGLRQIIAFLALGALLGKISGRGLAFRLTLFALAAPVAILANVVRVLLMGFGAVLFGTGWIKGWLHHAPAAFSLPMGIALYLGLAFLLERLWPAPKDAPKEEPCPSPAA